MTNEMVFESVPRLLEKNNATKLNFLIYLLIKLKPENMETSTKAVPKKSPLKGEKDPCWDGYQKEGLKTKKGKEVPNCVKK